MIWTGFDAYSFLVLNCASEIMFFYRVDSAFIPKTTDIHHKKIKIQNKISNFVLNKYEIKTDYRRRKRFK